MKIACVLGSPRKTGNSATIANHFLKTAEGLGADTKSFLLNTLHYKGCQACYSCKKKSEKCVIEDDLSEVLDTVKESDVLVMATGTYYGEITSQLKAFIDRTFSFLVPDFHTSPNPSRLRPGKKLVFIITQGQPDEKMFDDIFPRYERFLKWYGYSETHLIRVCGTSQDDNMMNRDAVVRLTKDIAHKVCS